jgi:hypothetical protein
VAFGGRNLIVEIMENESWGRKVAELVLDAVVDYDLLRREDFDVAVEIAAEEIQIRLAMADYPPIDDQLVSGSP